jgi:hypothetical protein
VQTFGGDSAHAAITAPEREFLVDLKVDWNRNGNYAHPLSDLSGFVSKVSVNRSLTGSLPSELTLIQGAGAAELTFELAGRYNGLPMDGVFSQYQVLSPFWGKQTVTAEVIYRLGVQTALGIVWYPQFVGRIRTIQPDRASSTATLTALDRVEELRKPVMFPSWAMYEWQRTVKGNVDAQLADPMWVMDHCLRFCDTSPTPYRHATRDENMVLDGSGLLGVQLWVNGTGSIAPTVGWLDNYVPQEFPTAFDTMYEPLGSYHPNSPEPTTPPKGMRAVNNNPDLDTLVYWVQDRDKINPLGIQGVGFTLLTRGRFPTYWQTCPTHDVISVRVGWGNIIRLRIGAGNVWSEYWSSATSSWTVGPSVAVPTGQDFVRVNSVWDFYGTTGVLNWTQAGANKSGNTWTWTGGPQPVTPGSDFLQGRAETTHQVGWNDLYYFSTNFGSEGGNALPDPSVGVTSWGTRAAKYVAVLDPGMNRLSYLPIRKAEDSWEVISEVATSEFGAVFWDESGVFRFWNYDRLRKKQSSIVRELTVEDLQSLNTSLTADSIRNIYSINTGQAVSQRGIGIAASSQDQFYVPGSTEKLFRIWKDDVLAVNPGKVDRYTTISGSSLPTWNDQVQHGYVVQWLVGGVWAENISRSSGVDIFAYLDQNDNVVVKIYNGYSEPMRLSTDGNAPALHVGGTVVARGDDQVDTYKDLDSIKRFGGRNLPLQGDWYQEFTNYAGLLTGLLAKTSRPVPSTDNIQVPGDPRIQLGDTVRIQDRFVMGERIDCQIFGINREYSVDGGLVDTLSVEIVRPSGGLWDDPVYGKWDQTLMWGA